MIQRSLWLRPTLARPGRTLLTVLGVAVGVASVISTLLASRAAVASLGRDVEIVAGRARLEVTRPGGLSPDDLRALRPLCDAARLCPVVEEPALAPALGDVVRLLGVDLLGGVEERGLGWRDVAEGELAEARRTMLHGRGAALSVDLARVLGVAPGDTLPLVVHAREVELRVALLFEPERFPSAWERLVLVDVSLAQELAGRGGRVDRIEVVPRGDADTGDLRKALEASLPAGYRVAPASERREEGERLVRALDFNLTALAGVSILVGIVLVATTLATAIVQRRAQLALYRSLGASNLQLAGAVLCEAACIGLLGGALGVGLGFAGAHGAVDGVRATVASIAEGTTSGRIAFDARWAALGLALGVGTALAAAVLPLREVLRTPPVQALRHGEPASTPGPAWVRPALVTALLAGGALFARLPAPDDRPVWALLTALAILGTLPVLAAPLIELCTRLSVGSPVGRIGLPLRLAQAALRAGKGRAAWAAAAVAIAVALAVSMTTMVGSFRHSVVEWTEQAMPSDLFLRPLATNTGALVGRVDSEVVAIARATFGVEAVDPFHQSKAYLDGEPILMGGAAFGVVAREGGVPFLDGRRSEDVFEEALARGGVVVNEPLARRFDVAASDRIALETPAGTIEREVIGVYRDYSGHTGRAVLDLGDFLSHYPDEGAHSVAIFVPETVEVAVARADLARALDGRFAVEVLDNREVKEEVLRIFEQTFGVTVALQLIASIVAAIAVVSVLSALTYERRRELAVVRVLGASRPQVFGLILGQALLLGLAGALGGVLAGLAVGWVLVAIVNVQSFGWTLDFRVPPTLLLTLAVVLPVCTAAGILPALRSLRTSPKEALRASH